MVENAIIQIKDLTKVIGTDPIITLVSEINLKIEKGEFVSIVGPSGSGKSSLLYLMGLLDDPSKGEVVIDGVSSSKLSETAKADLRLEKLGFVFQFHFLLPEFTALENVMLPMQRLGRIEFQQMEERAYVLLKDLGLEKEIYKKPKQMSGGQSQRVAIARAMANEPEIILADEPTGNLDTKSSENVRQILQELSLKNKVTVVAVTHDQNFAKNAQRIITIVDGRIRLD